MNRGLNTRANSSGSNNLSPLQRQLLSYFNNMSLDVQDSFVAMAQEMARTLPRNRPQLRVIAGGAA